MNYGQIIFQLEDYYNYGGTISTTVDGNIQKVTAVAPDNNLDIGNESINIYKNNLVSDNKPWDKIGIQAPPGTKFQLNDQQFIIGPSGIYELSNVNITSLKFLPLVQYQINKGAIETYLSSGKNIMQDAINEYSQKIKGLSLDTQENIDWYKKITEEYISLYETGYNQYQVGVNGIYDSNGYQIQKNIIIDYRIKSEQEEVN